VFSKAPEQNLNGEHVDTQTYLDFDLSISRTDAGYRATVQNSPAGQASAEFQIPFSEHEIEIFLLRLGGRRPVRKVGTRERSAAEAFGGRLFDAVFTDDLRSCFHSSISEANRDGKGLRVRLRFTDAPEAADLPWEYLYQRRLNRFLALSIETPIVRYLELPERITPLRVRSPVHIVTMIASPEGYDKLDVEKEFNKLQEALAELEANNSVTLKRLSKPTLNCLQQDLRRSDYHIFHFVGHGRFSEELEEGHLLLEDERGRARFVSGSQIATVLHNKRSLRLCVLNACEGARTSPGNPFAGIAQSIVQQGVPAVVANQFEISDDAAISFAHAFYHALADNSPVDAALTHARVTLYHENREVEWGTPVLYMRSDDGQIFDVERLVQPKPEQPPSALDNATGNKKRRPQRFVTLRRLLVSIPFIVGAAVFLILGTYIYQKQLRNAHQRLQSPVIVESSRPPQGNQVLASSSPALLENSPVQEAEQVGRSVDLFYKNLSGGAWFEVEDYGYCWQPDVAVSPSDWRPYTDGYWAYTEVGWTWISYEDFGWATYHYGAWTELADYGWVWFPSANLKWGPAWVSWRKGDDIIGWAPLPPRGPGIVYAGKGISGNVDAEFQISADSYNFISIKFIGEPVLRGKFFNLNQNQTYMNQTRNVTNITVSKNVVYNRGIDIDLISQYSNRPIPRLHLEQNADINAAIKEYRSIIRVQGNSVTVAAPQTIETPTKQMEPPSVKAKLPRYKVQRGW
jgi:hypothetical protein